jgi:large subunit ribosomal protein L24
MTTKIKLKKGDKVVVRTGRDKGKSGEIVKILPRVGRAVVSGINLATHHERATATDQGGIKKIEASIEISNLGIQDPKDGKASRIGFKVLEDGRKVRVATRSGEAIDA